MSVFGCDVKKNLYLFFCVIILVVNSSAQTGWNLIRRTGTDDLVSVFFVNSEKGWIAGDNGFFASTTDNGKTWQKQNLASKNNINEVYFRDEKNGFVLSGEKIFTTNDAGANWREIKSFVLSNDGIPEYYGIRFANKKTGWITGSISKGSKLDSLLLKTDDGGQTWQKFVVPIQTELFSLDFIDDKKGWVVGDNGTIAFTDNGGNTWKVQNSGTTESIYSVDFRNSFEGIAVGTKGVILRTENGGNTWDKVKTNFPNSFLRVSFIDEKSGWIVGRSGTILRTDDKGKTWIKQDSKTSDNLFGFFMEKKFGWAVGGKGVILKYNR